MWTRGTRGEAARQADTPGVRRAVIKPAEPKTGSVRLPRRWVVERTFGRLGRSRRLARDDERLATTLTAWHRAAAGTRMPGRWTEIIGIST
jgi:transposase